MLETFTRIPVEHRLIERVKQEKSLVGIQLTAGACREHYQNHVDSFIIASSDSDYWGLISSLTDADFLLLVELIRRSIITRKRVFKGDTYFYNTSIIVLD